MPKGVYVRTKPPKAEFEREHRETGSKGARKRELAITRRAQRNEIDRKKDTWFAVQEYARGKSYKEIAEEISAMNNYHIEPYVIRKDIEEAMIQWKRDNMDNIEAYIAGELARLDRIERVAKEDYERSKTLRPKDYAVLMKRGLSVGEVDEIFAEKGGGGDPRYIEVMLKVQAQKMKLLGIDKGNDVVQQTNVVYNFEGLSDDALAKLADGMQDRKYEEIIVEAEEVK